MSNYNARINMVKQQLRTGNVLNETILQLYDLIPRHQFVPREFMDFAYSDMQIPLAQGQKMMTPLEEGTILQALDLKPHETVLEIGTGSGFLTAMMSKQCKQILSIDYYPEFTLSAAAQLKAHGCTNVELITGDASKGWLEHAPYDVIVFTGAVDQLNKTQQLQVLPGGRLFAIEGHSPAMRARLHSLSHSEVWTETLLFETDLPPLVDPSRPKEEFVF